MARESRRTGRRLRRCAAGLVAVLLAAGVRGPARAAAAGGAGAGAAARPYSIQDSPGYVPLVDPEAASVVLGRRLNAPLVSARFEGGARSLDDLGRAVLWALHHSDPDSLRRLCVSRLEFERIMWREFPESRPATGLTAGDAWASLDRRFVAGVGGAVNEYGGRTLEFQRVEVYESVRTYRNFRLHNGLVIVATNERGEEERLRFVRAAVERKGRFKIQSTAD
jgi:hypothetical protein